MVGIVEVDLSLLTRFQVEDITLVLIGVERRCGDRESLLGQCAGTRLRELCRGVNHRQILFVVLHTVATTLAERHLVSRRIVGQEIDIVVVTQVQLNQLRKLTNRRRHIAREGEITQIEARHTTIRVQFDTRLIAPQVGILVEIPIRTGREILTHVVPRLTIEALPDLAQSVVILYIFVGRVQRNGDRTLGGAIVRNREICTLNIAKHLQHHSTRIVGHQRHHAIVARCERKCCITND